MLISRLGGSAQEPDLTLPSKCGGYGRVRHFRLDTSPGWPFNPLPILPACKALGLDPKWAFNVIKQVGNFGEMWDRNITPMGVTRGINNIWTKGGLQYAPPIR